MKKDLGIMGRFMGGFAEKKPTEPKKKKVDLKTRLAKKK